MQFAKKYWVLIILPFSIFFAAWLAIRIANSNIWRNSDFFTFWLAGHLAAQGGNPYSPAQWLAGHHEFGVTWIPNQAYVYPLPLSLLYMPLGLLDQKTAYIVWDTLSMFMMLAALILLIKSRASHRLDWFFFPILAGLIVFRPTWLTLTNGQFSAFMLFLLTGTTFFWNKGKWEWGSSLIPLLMLKPNLGAPLVLLLGAWLLAKRRWKSLAVIAAGLLALLLIGFLQNPHWVRDYWSIGNLKVSQNVWGVPTLWGLGSLLCGHDTTCTLMFGGLTSALLIMGFLWLVIWRWKQVPPFTLIALAATVTLLVTPYIWTYDQLLLLIPIIDLTFAMDNNGRHFLVACLFFIMVDLLTIVLLIFDTMMELEIFNAIIPLILLAIYGTIQLSRHRKTLLPVPK